MPTSGSRISHGGNRAFHNFANDYSHIADPNLRRRLALSEIDKVPLGLYHVRAVAVAGVGFLLDSYDIFAISQVTSLLGLAFWGGNGNGGRLPDPVNQALKAATSAGIIVGQLLFGWLADVFGRRRMYGLELAIIVLSTLGCALACPSPSMTATGLLVFWRVIMGIGIGGDYPLSSVITSECVVSVMLYSLMLTSRFAPTRWRGAMMASVFSMQGVGQLLSAIVALIVTVAFRADFAGIRDAAACDTRCRLAADRAWRIIVGVGALPASFALYYRITIPETPRYTFDVAYDLEKADADIRAYTRHWPAGSSPTDDDNNQSRNNKNKNSVDPFVQARLKRLAGPALAAAGAVPPASWPDLLAYFGSARPLRVLLGTTLSWFFLDLAFYGLALNNAVVLEAIGYASGKNLFEVLYHNALGTIILACAGSLPGYATAIATIDTVGRKPLQVFGFAILTVLFCVLGFALHHLDKGALLGLYIAAQFFFNCGPNTTTFVIPGECFPTRYRSTAHGLSAAMGKLGAILAQVISIPILSRGTTTTASSSSSPWLNRLLQIFALFMLCGTLVSLVCIPETKGVTLEVLAGEPPTSYHAGRRRPSPPGTRAAWLPTPWRPFAGGQPAGFFYPPMRTHHHAAVTATDTTGGAAAASAMTTTRCYHSWWKRRGRQHNLHLADGIGHRLFGRQRKDSVDAASASDAPLSPSSRANTAPGADDLDGPAVVLPPPPAATFGGGGGVFPGWGAGWGRIDRGGQPAAWPEDICLQDVGQLLK